MLLVIFGAGASYDSVDLALAPSLEAKVKAGTAMRLPLASQLFDDREEFMTWVRNLPRLQAIVPRLRKAGKYGNIEAELQQILAEADRVPDSPAQLVAVRKYLHEIINDTAGKWLRECGGATNYAALLNQFSRAKPDIGGGSEDWLTLVTFNYDTLLESALDAKWGIFHHTMDDYLNPVAPVIRPHGCTQWVQFVPGEFLESIESEAKLGTLTTQQGGLLPIHHRISAPNVDSATTILPAVAIPVESKTTFMVPPSHLELLRQRLLGVTHVLIVGWQANEKHFLNFLAESIPVNGSPLSLCVVDKTNPESVGHPASRIAEWFQGHLPRVVWRQVKTFDGGFSEFVRENGFDEWMYGSVRAPSMPRTSRGPLDGRR